MGINTMPPRRRGDTKQQINIQANISQDKPPDIDIRDMPGSTLSGTYRGRPQGSSDVSDLAGHELKEEDYPIVDYESELQTAMSTTVREATPNIVLV